MMSFRGTRDETNNLWYQNVEGFQEINNSLVYIFVPKVALLHTIVTLQVYNF